MSVEQALGKGIYFSPYEGADSSLYSITQEQIRVGSSVYNYSPRLNEHIFHINLENFDKLWLGVSHENSVCPDYDFKKSLLVVNEPHSMASAQFRLYKGLEIFFDENPALLDNTIFLTEGFPANQEISLQSLIDEEPNPSDELVQEVLQSFLINGAMAYEWKHQTGIPMIGIENPHLYKLSRDFALLSGHYGDSIFFRGRLKQAEKFLKQDAFLWETIQNARRGIASKRDLNEFGGTIDVSESGEIIWNFSYNTMWGQICTARNMEMARTLIRSSHYYENPMLFIGSMHLISQEDFRFSAFQELIAQMNPNESFSKQEINQLLKAENWGVYDYLRGKKIGFTFLDPEKLGDVADYGSYYSHLFQAQQDIDSKNTNYDQYIDYLLSQRGVNRGTTVTPSPEGASELVRALKKRGTIYEQPAQNQERPNWFTINPQEVWATIVKKSIWHQPVTYQGRDYEQLRMANLGSNCPVIDDIAINAKTATSMKTLDLTSRTYQNPIALESKVKTYIDKLSEFTGGQWNGHTFIRGQDFNDRYLEIGIPSGRATSEQIIKLTELQDYAQNKDITLVINEVP